MPKFVKIIFVCLICLTAVGGVGWLIQWVLGKGFPLLTGLFGALMVERYGVCGCLY
jgi:hypothetical protein